MLYNEAAGQIWLAYRSQHLQFSAFVEGFAAADKKGDGARPWGLNVEERALTLITQTGETS